jgi:ABC-2 type transport system ATP-binding protein
MQTLMAEVAETGLTVVLSSHVIAELEGVCDHLLLLGAGQVRLAGDVENLLADHRLISGVHRPGPVDLAPHTIVEHSSTGRQTTLLIRTHGSFDQPGWAVDTPTLEELVLAYLRTPGAPRTERTAVA